MSTIKQHIPNLITTGNLVCGCLGLAFIYGGNFPMASWMIILAAVLDLFDGMAARALGVSSPIGEQLDSLADMLSFGVLPAFILFDLVHASGHHHDWVRYYLSAGAYSSAIPVFIYSVGAAWRLARFNANSDEKVEFIGLPSPAAALVVAGIGLTYGKGLLLTPFPHEWLDKAIMNPYVLIGTALLLAILMNSKMRMLSFKNLNSSKTKVNAAILLLGAIASLWLFAYLGIIVVVLLYLLLSFVKSIRKNAL